MPDQDSEGSADPRVPSELFRSTESHAAVHLAAALGGLDRATRNFSRRLGEGRHQAGAETTGQPSSHAPFDERMEEAEMEARAYLEGAKRRADSLVASMLSAVEREATEIRRNAEEGIRARWDQAEIDAGRHVENARLVAERIVAERQRRIAALSDGIADRATALTSGMDDAEQVRAQFDAFVRALSVTADRIASAHGNDGAAGVHALRDHPRSSMLAA